jgi:hypothetical protein
MEVDRPSRIIVIVLFPEYATALRMENTSGHKRVYRLALLERWV